MTPQESDKPSVGNSQAEQPSDFVLFLDNDTGSRLVVDALQRGGVRVEIHKNHFAGDTPDDIWIPEVSNRGWIIISSDKRTRRRPNEIRALVRGRARAFILTSGDLTGQEIAHALIKGLKRIRSTSMSQPRPFVATNNKQGKVELLLSRRQLEDKLARLTK